MNAFYLIIFVLYEGIAVIVGTSLIIRQIKQKKFSLNTAIEIACLSPIIWPIFVCKKQRPRPVKRVKQTEPIWHNWRRLPLCHMCSAYVNCDDVICRHCGVDRPSPGWQHYTLRTAYNLAPKDIHQYRLPDGTITQTFPGRITSEKAPQI